MLQPAPAGSRSPKCSGKGILLSLVLAVVCSQTSDSNLHVQDPHCSLCLKYHVGLHCELSSVFGEEGGEEIPDSPAFT